MFNRDDFRLVLRWLRGDPTVSWVDALRAVSRLMSSTLDVFVGEGGLPTDGPQIAHALYSGPQYHAGDRHSLAVALEEAERAYFDSAPDGAQHALKMPKFLGPLLAYILQLLMAQAGSAGNVAVRPMGVTDGMERGMAQGQTPGGMSRADARMGAAPAPSMGQYTGSAPGQGPAVGGPANPPTGTQAPANPPKGGRS